MNTTMKPLIQGTLDILFGVAVCLGILALWATTIVAPIAIALDTFLHRMTNR